MPRSFWSIVLATVAILTLDPSTAHAQASTEAPDAEQLMALSFDELIDIDVRHVYGASKFDQPIAEAPSAITIIDSKQIKRYGYRTLAEILRSVRGFYIGNDRNYTYIGVRGFLRPGDNNSRVLLLINGHRMNDNVYDGASIGHEFMLDVDLIDRVEIVRGPSSAIYGNSAFFAVINVITKSPKAQSGAEVSGEVGGLGAHRARFTVADEFKNGASLLVSGTYYDRRGERRLYYPEFDDPSTNFGVARRRDWEEAHYLFTQFNYRSFTIDGGFQVRDKAVPTGAFETAFNHSDNQTEDLNAFINARHIHDLTDEIQLTSRLNYGQHHFNGIYVYEGELPGDPAFIPNFDRARGKWLIAETSLRAPVFKKHYAMAGFEYRYDIERDQMNFDKVPPFTYLDTQRHGQVWSPYANLELNVRTNLTLNAGLRHDQYDTFGGTTNPRAGLIYQARPRTTLKYIYGEAFRAPNAFELYYGDAGFTAKPNPQLNPEEINTHELIWEERLNPTFSTSVSVFQYDISNLISQMVDPADDLLVHQNIDEIRAQGAEFELTARRANGLQGRISYAFQDSEDLGTAGGLMNAPSHLVKFHIMVPIIRDSLFLGWESLYTSHRIATSRQKVDGFWLNNLTLFSQNLRPGLELSGTVYNLFDEQYFDPAGPEHLQSMIQQERRTFRIKLTYRF